MPVSNQTDHSSVPAKALDVIAGDESAETVADDMDAVVAAAVTQLLDDRAEFQCRLTYVLGKDAVVHGRPPADRSRHVAVICGGST